ncbi:MAG: LEA type 2 family protein [Bacteroidota bacterium]
MNKVKIILLSLVVILSSCDVLKEASSLYNFTKCDFRLNNVENVRLAGVNVQKAQKLSDLSLFDAAKLTAAVATHHFPLDVTLNIEVKNPNTQKATMNGMEWILLIDDIEMTRGKLDQRIEVMPNNQSTIMPLTLSVDLDKVLTGKSADAIINFGLNLSGNGNKPTRIALRAKPSILIGSITVPYPDYITIRTEFGK